ncbi:MAG: NAD(P)-dependent alcohol dehydrogenase [Burkholderiaceae bacterium]
MKAVAYEKYGSPDVLRVIDVPVPAPGPGEVLVRVRAVSLNAWDWDTLTGRPLEYRVLSGLCRPRHRLIHGCDIAGVVESVGAGVSGFRRGDPVLGDLAEDGWGAFAEFVCAPETRLAHKPAGMSFEQAACISHGGNLAIQGLFDHGHIDKARRVLINGGGGSTGSLAIQLARTYDVELSCVDHARKLDQMRALGADHVIDYARHDFTRSGVRYDLIFDVRTSRGVFEIARALAPAGRYVTVGGKTSRLLQMLALRRLTGHPMQMVAYQPNKDLPQLLSLFEQGRVCPVIDRCFDLERTVDAFRLYGSGAFFGKIVVRVGDAAVSSGSDSG